MRLYLVRSGTARDPSQWEGSDKRRPLAEIGHRQARGLVKLLQGISIDRILSSPAARCRQTIAPLAADRRVSLELEGRLAEGARVETALELIRSMRAGTQVLCTHRANILALLEALVEDPAVVARARERCEQGSVWQLDVPPVEAAYLGALTARRGNRRREAASLLGSGEFAETRVAVLDLGSTSFHLLVTALTPDGSLKHIARKRDMLRLGRELTQHRRIPEAVMERAVAAAVELRAFAEAERADELIPVGTAALREAENGPELSARLAAALGAPVWILDGSQEARLIFNAIRSRLELGRGLTLGLDLGGGSLEIALGGETSDVVWETTLPLGVARLDGELARRDAAGRVPRRDLKAVRRRVREILAPHRAHLLALSPRRCVAVGGTVRALARLVAAEKRQQSVRGLCVAADDLSDLSVELARTSHDERLEMRGMNPRRADLLPVGAAIVAAVLAELGLEQLVVCDWGLREGVVLEVLGH